MYNNPYLNKLNANKQMLIPQGMNQTGNGNSKDRPINIVDQKKLDNSIMIMT